MKNIQTEDIIAHLKNLVKIPSPTGYTRDIEDFLLKTAQRSQIACEHTRKGAVLYKFEAEAAESNLMFTAHVDTLGAMVSKVGRSSVSLSSIGGNPVIYLIGDYCTIHAFDGKTYEGTILPKNPAAHVNNGLNSLKLTIEQLEVRVDLPLKESQDALQQRIEVGNFVSFDPKFRRVNGFVKCRHLDDKASAAILLHVATLLTQEASRLKRNIYFFFNCTEETGQGIGGFPPLDECIIVDMGVVGDAAAGDEYHVSICAKDSSGPYHYALTQRLIAIARQRGISYKSDVFPFYSSDGSSALRAGSDMRVALIGPGVSASHGYERSHTAALLNTAKLIVGFIEETALR
ncbi:hypothetical protein CSB45_14335 [candidate division KSB3 bacterium]|uniref:Peptidase M42 n=1 Tax=candidate division KSB3 bacterium TaxID=2044937 RepID=A0A2G6E1E4_9BACT|nr:MAG: hypothetical protein CSB45_14335 [candidate division KSB3 bacterium]PIE30332.1 MAG: hypothetical protein CSA57_03335 [candidate division KSB3 bacterium]